MKSNVDITKEILCNNVHGSFLVIMHRTREPSIVDFISPLRISIYHFIIIRENKRFKFLDILDCVHAPNDNDIHFNDLEKKFPDHDFYFNEEDLYPTQRTSRYRTINIRDRWWNRLMRFLKRPNKIEHIKKEIDRQKKINIQVRHQLRCIQDILSNKASALLFSRDNLLKKVCAYKIQVMKGYDLPVYKMRVTGKSIRKFDIVTGEDILETTHLKKEFRKNINAIL